MLLKWFDENWNQIKPILPYAIAAALVSEQAAAPAQPTIGQTFPVPLIQTPAPKTAPPQQQPTAPAEESWLTDDESWPPEEQQPAAPAKRPWWLPEEQQPTVPEEQQPTVPAEDIPLPEKQQPAEYPWLTEEPFLDF